ncbi:MAG: WXG100 family type VII secretion target [Anaerolineales bacterium]
MTAPQFRGDYDLLAQIAQAFGQHASLTKTSMQRIQRDVNTLQSGDWIGTGATAFYREMNDQVLPTLKRLTAALESADRTLRKVSQIIKQAEDEAARLFRLDGTGGLGAVLGGGLGGALGGTLGGVGEATTFFARDPMGLFSRDYMRGLIGLHIPGEGSELGDAMNGLLGATGADDAEGYLVIIAELRGRPLDDIRSEYERFQEIQGQRDAAVEAGKGAIPGVSGANSGFMGSNMQMRYGQMVGDAFGVDPVFGAMLNPTGGLVGPGNFTLHPGGDTPIGYHSVVHDAAGYLHTYHGAGPGYNYLGVEPFPTSFPGTGQVSGIAYWTVQMGGMDPVQTVGEVAASTAASSFRAAVDAGSWVFDKAASIF